MTYKSAMNTSNIRKINQFLVDESALRISSFDIESISDFLRKLIRLANRGNLKATDRKRRIRHKTPLPKPELLQLALPDLHK
jgi:hypothetical protein